MSATQFRILNPPDCRRDLHYRRLSPKEGHYVNRYEMLLHVRLRCRDLVPPGTALSFRLADGTEALRVDEFGILLAEGFRWDGCTPKRYIPVLGWVGTPDFEPSTIFASALHDLLYQFHDAEGFPWTREECDAIFKAVIESYGEHDLARVYHFFVRGLGSWDSRKAEGRTVVRV